MLQKLQRQLSEIYDLPPTADISEFLLDSATTQASAGRHEEILIEMGADDNVGIGVYLHADILDNLKDHCPENRLDQRNLAAFCLAVESVSHFLYVDFAVRFGRSLSALQLEMQAEVDKFVCCFIYQYHQNRSLAQAQALFTGLFQAFQWQDGLASEEKARYELANRTAARICQALCLHFLQPPQPDWIGLFRFLRRFYRQGWNQKFAIANMPSRSHLRLVL